MGPGSVEILSSSTDGGTTAPPPNTLCSRKINEKAHREHTIVKHPIMLDLHQTEPVINFGSSRGLVSDFVVFKASHRIPRYVFSTTFEIDSLEPLKRIGEGGLESVRLDPPTFSPPHFFNHRTEIGFNLCVSAAEGDPGTYTGQFLFVGPKGISSVTIPQTAQLKLTEHKFLRYLIAVLLLTFLLLGIRTFGEFDDSNKNPERILRLLALLAPVGAAGVAVYLVYDKTPTWGTDLPISAAALIGTAFTAAGLGNSFAGTTERFAKTWKRGKESKKDKSADAPTPTTPEDPAVS